MIIVNEILVKVNPKDVKHGTIKFQKRVVGIGDKAFAGLTNLITLNIPEGVEEIGFSAFKGCTRLKKVVLPESLEFVDEYAFDGCHKLKTVNIPRYLTVIPQYMFRNCKSLKKLTIHPFIKRFNANAFIGCDGAVITMYGEPEILYGDEPISDLFDDVEANIMNDSQSDGEEILYYAEPITN